MKTHHIRGAKFVLYKNMHKLVINFHDLGRLLMPNSDPRDRNVYSIPQGDGALAGQLCTDVRIQECKTVFSTFLNFIPFFTVSSQKVTLSTLVN